jgi:hypothetical protein
MTHARLRRVSPISQFAVAAALEALRGESLVVRQPSFRLGLVLNVMAGCVNYTRRFYDETLRDPRTASPLIFPETVFNAPASHLASYLGTSGLNYTLVGDQGAFLVGLALAADWLQSGEVDGCLVIGAEECDWMVADAFHRFERRVVVSEGAGALYLQAGTRGNLSSRAVRLDCITDAHSFLRRQSRMEAAQAMRAQLPGGGAVERELLCDGTQQANMLDKSERRVWEDWAGARLSPKLVLGEGLAAAPAWQCVAAADALEQRDLHASVVSVVGCNQQAIGARFVRSGAPAPGE